MNPRRTRPCCWRILPAAAVIAIVSLAGPVRGSTILRLTDLTSGEQQIIIDEAPAGTLSDSDLAATADDFAAGYAGTVMHHGAVGSFDVVVAAGNSRALTGPSGGGRIDLVSLLVSGGTGELEIELTATGFRVAPGHTSAQLESSLGGTTDGIVIGEAYVDPGNREFGTSIGAGPLGPFQPASHGPASDKSLTGFARTSLDVAPNREFSITQRFVVRHPSGTSAEATSLHAVARVHAPEPATLAMFGAGLASLLLWARRRRRL